MKPALNQQATRTTNGTQNWTDASIASDQTLALFFGTEATTNNTTTAAAKLFLGATDLVNSISHTVGTIDATAAASAVSHSLESTTKTLLRTTSGGSENLAAVISAVLSNGITINQTTSDGGAYLFNGLSLAGSDHVVHVSNTTFATTDLSKVVTHGDSSAPDTVLIFGSISSSGTAATDTGLVPQKSFLGFWDGTNSVGVTMNCSASVSPTRLDGIATTDLGHQIDNTGVNVAAFSIGSVGATTFTLTRTATGTTAVIITCISIRHTSGTWASKCGLTTLPSSGSSPVALVTGLAAAQVLFLVPTRLTSTALAANSDSAGSLGFGVACNNNGTVQQAACGMTEKNAVTTSVAKCYTSNTLALVRLDNTGTPVNPATASFPAGGVSLTPSSSWTSADEIMYLVIGIAPPTTPLAATPAIAVSDTAALTTAIQTVAAASASINAIAALTNWTTVTLSGVQYTGIGGIHDPNFWLDVDPPVGSVLYYDATNITIYANGEISSTTNNCSAVVQFFDGTAWSYGVVVITPQMVSYAQVLAAAAGALTTGIRMAGAALVTAQSSAGLATAIALASMGLGVVNAATAMITAIQLDAVASASVGASGALTGGVASLQGSASVLSQALGGLTTQVELAAQALVNVQTVGSLTAQIAFSGLANALTSATTQLSTAIQLAGNSNISLTASGAALLTSQFAGVANTVLTATGLVQTGISMAGVALVQTSATGDLTTGVLLSGAAQIETVSALQPVAPKTSQFGRAEVNILSPTGFPVVEPTFVEGTSVTATVSYFNILGLPFIPATVSYQVNDVDSDQLLVPLTSVAPSLSNTLTIPGTENEMVNLTRVSEEHQLLFTIEDGLGQTYYQIGTFEIVTVAGLH